MPSLFVEQLTVIDASRLDPEAGLVGESWIVDVELTGELDARGMIVDFGDVKRQLKAAIDRLVDHRLLVPAASTEWQDHDGVVTVRFASARGPIHMSGPAHTVVSVPGERVATDAVRALLHEHLRGLLPDNVTGFGLRLRRERIEGAWYAYSHGLREHDGACQRIAHGHRCRVEVYRNGQRAPDWEAFWAQRWHNVYLGSRAHLADETERDGVATYRFAYTAGEGAFSLELPAADCELLDTTSTVEQIAAHMSAVMAEREPHAHLSVRTYEGVGKGARADA
ncbi:MAG: 6-carboxytetrahydropterin synthase [Ectothiorhodospiraceae bacterium]